MANRLEVIMSGNAKPLNDAIGEANRKVDDMVGHIQGAAQAATVAFGAIAAGGALLTKTFLDGASEMQRYEARLTKLTGSTEEAQKQLSKMKEIASKTPFDLPGVVEAGVKLKGLGQDVDRFLPLAADFASVMGRSVPEAAQILGKALAGSQDGITALADSGLISKKELGEMGAIMKADGSIATDSSLAIEKLREAIVKVAEKKNFVGAAQAESATFAGTLSNLSDAVGQLGAEIGKTLVPTFQALAGYIGGVVEAARAMPDWMKAVIGFGTVLVTVIAGIGAAAAAAVVGAAGLAASLSALSTTMVAMGGAGAAAAAGEAAVGVAGAAAAPGVASLGAAAAAALLPLTAIVAVAALIGAAGFALIKSMEAQTEATNQQIAAEVKLLRLLHEKKDLLGKTADQLRAAGQTDVDVTKAILGLQQLQYKAEEQGDKERAARYQAEIDRLRQVRVELAGTAEAAKKAADERAAAEKAATEKGQVLAEEYKARVSASYYATKDEQLKALDEVIAKLSKGDEDSKKRAKELELDRVNLARQASKERLDNELATLAQQAAANDLSKEEQAARLRELAAEYKDLADERVKLETEATKLEIAAAQERSKAELETLEAKRKTSELSAAAAEKELADGNRIQENRAKILASLKEQADLEQQAIQKRANSEKSNTADPKVRAEIQRKADEEIAQSKQRLGQAEEELAERVGAANAKRYQSSAETAKKEKELIDQQIAGLDARLKKGEDVEEELSALLKEREQAQLNAVAAEEQAALATEQNEQRRVQIKRQAQLEEEKIATEGLQKQEALRKDAEARQQAEGKATLDAAKSVSDQKIALLQREQAAGADVSQKLKAAIKERLDLELQAIQAQLEARKASTDSVEEEAAAEVEAQVAIREARLKAAEAIGEQIAKNEELKRSNDSLLGKGGFTTGDVKSIQDAFKTDDTPQKSPFAKDKTTDANSEAVKKGLKDLGLTEGDVGIGQTDNLGKPGGTGGRPAESVKGGAAFEVSIAVEGAAVDAGQTLADFFSQFATTPNRPEGIA